MSTLTTSESLEVMRIETRRYGFTALVLACVSCALATFVISSSAAAEPSDEETDASATTSQPADAAAETEYFDDEHRQRLYRSSKLEHYKAALWTALLPGLGNIYARQYFMAGLNLSLMGFTAIFLSYGLVTERMPAVWASAVTSGLAYTSGFTSSLIGVTAYNNRLRRSLQVSAIPRPGGRTGLPLTPAIRISVRF